MSWAASIPLREMHVRMEHPRDGERFTSSTNFHEEAIMRKGAYPRDETLENYREYRNQNDGREQVKADPEDAEKLLKEADKAEGSDQDIAPKD
ncbi:MAG: hypothetical protein AAGA69_03760 [Pseudomonadota bacterium]